MTDRTLAEIGRPECLELLGSASIARVGVSIDAVPAVLPVLICVIGPSIVFRTVPGTKLTAALSRAVVAVEVDGYDPETRQGWSVLVRGVASEVTDPDVAAQARARLPHTWLSEDHAEHLVGVGLDLVTGRRLHAS